MRCLSIGTLSGVLFVLSPGEKLSSARFAPREDSELLRRVHTELSLSYEELTSTFDGQDVPPEFLPQMEIDIETARDLLVRDVILKATDQLPLEVERTYETVDEATAKTISVTPPGFVDEGEYEADCELEGSVVRFLWDEDDGEYEAKFAEDEGPGELLAGLDFELDAQVLLPTEEVESGASWTVPGSRCASLFELGGDLGLEYEDEWNSPPGKYDGELQVTFQGFEEKGALAVITVEGVVEGVTEQATTLDHVPVSDGTATEVTTMRYELTGRLRWHRSQNHLLDLELKADVTSTTVTTKDPGQPGPEFDSTMVLVGEWSLELENALEQP